MEAVCRRCHTQCFVTAPLDHSGFEVTGGRIQYPRCHPSPCTFVFPPCSISSLAMPLHLLGKKSWNVYNTDNIARVQRDEAEAQAREADRERRQRADDGETRLAQLRGQGGPDSEVALSALEDADDDSRGHARKKRRVAGENDTDRDLRLAQHNISSGKRRKEISLTDAKGHIDLLQERAADTSGSKVRSGNDTQDMGMRLADAAGRNPQAGKPWYNSASADNSVQDAVGKDVWVNEDPRRKQREQKRIEASDPLAAMKKGVKQLRQAEASRKEWMEQRERDLVEVEDLARKERNHSRRRRHDEDSLDGFDLDAGLAEKGDHYETSRTHHRDRHPRSYHHHHHHHHHHSHRHRSRSRSPRRRKERRVSNSAPASSTPDIR